MGSSQQLQLLEMMQQSLVRNKPGVHLVEGIEICWYVLGPNISFVKYIYNLHFNTSLFRLERMRLYSI